MTRLSVARSLLVSREAPEEEEILPVLWQDNYFALLPGETRQITATFPSQDLGNRVPAGRN
jgi:hypothetical protein